jgi:succinyl-CoA synthetase beta subunit
VKIAKQNHSIGRNQGLGDWDSLELPGKIGILGNGTGSVLTTVDAVVNAGGKPGISLNLRHSFLTDTTPTTFSDRLQNGLKILATDHSIQVILVNFLGNIPQVSQMSEIIANFLQPDKAEIPQTASINGTRPKREGNWPRLVIRLAGSEFNSARKYLASLKIPNEGLTVVENLDEAVAEAVRLTKLANSKK